MVGVFTIKELKIIFKLNNLYRFPIKSGMTYLVIGVVFLYGGRTMVRNFDWLSQKRLFLHDGEYAIESVLAQSNVAAMYLLDGEMGKGKIYMERADKIFPKYPELLNNWGVYFMRNGEVEKAKKKFEECLTERPGYELCVRNLERFKQKE